MLLSLFGVTIFTYFIYWRLFQKADKPGWYSLIPIFNEYSLYEVAHKKIYFWIRLTISFIFSTTLAIAIVSMIINLYQSEAIREYMASVFKAVDFESEYAAEQFFEAIDFDNLPDGVITTLQSLAGPIIIIGITTIIFDIIKLICLIMQSVGLSKAFNKGAGFTCGLVLFNKIFLSILALSDDAYYEDVHKNLGHEKIVGTVALTSALMILGSILSIFIELPILFSNSTAVLTFATYFVFIGYWCAFIAEMLVIKKDKHIIKTILPSKSNSVLTLLLGLFVGFITNGLMILLAWMHKDFNFTLSTATLIPLLLIFVAVFIQSSAEELICRSFMYQKLKIVYSNKWVAIAVSALFFGMLHLENPNVTLLSIINICMVGFFYSLVIYYFDSFWFVAAHHAMWNFTQNIIFGLPNSGMAAQYSIMTINTATVKDSIFYDSGFGVEGTMITTLMYVVLCAVTIMLGKRVKENKESQSQPRDPYSCMEANE